MVDKKRIVNTTGKDSLIIEENINNSKYDNETKDLLRKQTERLNQLMEEKQISQIELSKKIGVASGSISNYSNGTRLISVDILPKLAKALGTSTDYLLGVSDVKHYSNNELNDLFGLNDESIENLTTLPSNIKNNINMLFSGNRDNVLYFFEKLEEYKKELSKYKKESKKGDTNRVWELDHLNISKYYLTEAFNSLIKE